MRFWDSSEVRVPPRPKEDPRKRAKIVALLLVALYFFRKPLLKLKDLIVRMFSATI